MIPIKNPEGIKRMREACAVAATVLSRLKEQVRPGITTHDLDQIGRDFIARSAPAAPATATRSASRRYPAYTCLSVNEEVVHGIGSMKRILRDGDIVSLDVVVEYNGYIGDNALTVPVGTIAPRTAELLKVTAEALTLGIAKATVGNRIGDISARHADLRRGPRLQRRPRDGRPRGGSRNARGAADSRTSAKGNSGEKIKAGMTLAIEPMVNLGGHAVQDPQRRLDGRHHRRISPPPTSNTPCSPPIRGPEILTIPRAI
jgi:methionyl aminopeptidase